jgi:hypothetical protein
MEWEELLKQHTKTIPCFSCVVQVPCSVIGDDGQVFVTNICDKFKNWMKERDEIVFPVVNKMWLQQFWKLGGEND